ncbi:MAG TPA: GNAT family N-acetyltransferase [Methanotrichaceae archaeon]|nr:GNAT family N-acetyltransferase [Methanotrichaceae archaeon]
MIIRKAEPGDLSRIVEIEGLCFPEETAFPPGMFAYLIRYAITLVAIEDDLIAGFIIGFASGGTGFIYTLDVHPDYRRKGIGAMLVSALEEKLRAVRAKRIRLEAALNNPAALALYRKAGYSEREMLRNYYGKGLHAVRMWKVLD